MEPSANNTLIEVSELLNTNKLSFDAEKPNFVTFHLPQEKVQPINFRVNHISLKHEESAYLSWKTHIREVSKKIS